MPLARANGMLTIDSDKPEDSKPEASQSSEPDPAEKGQTGEQGKPQNEEAEKEPEKVEETPQPPAKEESAEATSAEQLQPTSKPEEPSHSVEQMPADAPEQGEAEKPNAFSAMMEGKSPEDPQETQKAASSEQPSEAPKKDTQKMEEATSNAPSNTQAEDQSKSEPQQTGSSVEAKTDSAPTTNGDAVEPKAREDDVPSSILEKGIVYFFFRPRVNVTDPQNVNDIARSYIVLRPLPHGAALSDGTIPSGHNCRLIALPKKVLPVSGKDRFLVFVEKAKASFQELKDDFMSASDYATKSQGTSHTPPVTPVAEGVYAITSTGRESHLAYMTTIPSSLGEVQDDIGLRDSGSFIVSAKNPKYPSPANASIGQDPGYSEEIMTEFRDLRWMPLQPKLLDYVNTQFLLIGESRGVDGATVDETEEGKEGVKEEMEKLEGEDEIRVKGLSGKSVLGL